MSATIEDAARTFVRDERSGASWAIEKKIHTTASHQSSAGAMGGNGRLEPLLLAAWKAAATAHSFAAEFRQSHTRSGRLQACQ